MKIKRCPFCGSKDVKLIKGILFYKVKCNKCKASSDIQSLSIGAIEKWNMRVTEI